MNCKFCHAQIEDDAKVCPVCGADLTAETETEEPVTVEAIQEETVTEVLPAEETPVAETEQEQAPARKLFTKVIAVVCSVVLLLGLGAALWFALGGGFGSDDITVKTNYTEEADVAEKYADKVIAKIGDKTLTNREFQVFYWMEVVNFIQQNSYYLSYFGLDPTLPLSEQYANQEGLTWEQFFIDSALNNWHYYQCLQIEGEKNGNGMSEELRKSMEEMKSGLEMNAAVYNFASADAMLQQDMGSTVSLEVYMKYVELYYSGLEYFSNLYTTVNPTREEVENYFNVHGAEIQTTYGVTKESGKLVDVRHILVSVETNGTDENGNPVATEEDWAKCLSDAEKILASWQEGAATEDSFALLANTFSTDPGSNTTGGLYSYVYEGQMVTNFNDWCFDPSRQSGDTGIVKTDFGYHIIYYVQGDEGWFRRSEQALIEATCTEMLSEFMKENPLRVHYKNIVLSEFSLY